jgi:hypothetical protein
LPKVTLSRAFVFQFSLNTGTAVAFYQYKLVGYEIVVLFFSDAVFSVFLWLPFWNRYRKQCGLKHAGLY